MNLRIRSASRIEKFMEIYHFGLHEESITRTLQIHFKRQDFTECRFSHVHRIFMILVPFESAFKALSNGTEIMKIRQVLVSKIGEKVWGGLLNFQKHYV